MTEREALKLALEALEYNQANWQGKDKAITAIKEALAQPEQGPVAYWHKEFLKHNTTSDQPKQEPVAWDNCRSEKQCRSWCGNSACGSHWNDTSPPAQPEQEPVIGTKTWFEDGKVVTQHLTAKDIYKEPEQEPKCGAIIEVFGKDWRLEYMSLPVGKHKLYTQQYTYTAPPQRKPLSDEEIKELTMNGSDLMQDYAIKVARAIEAAHGIKE